MPRKLSEQVAVVTGASSGVGRAIARAFGAAGARVALIARTRVLAVRYEWRGSVLVAVHNLSSRPVTASLDAGARAVPALVDALSGDEVRGDGSGRFEVKPPGHGFSWLRVGERDAALEVP